MEDPLAAHVPNPGRMEELLVSGETDGYIVPRSSPTRKTRFDLVSVYAGPTLVSIDSHLGNRLASAALQRGLLPEFGTGPWISEVAVGHHRIDFASVDREQRRRVTALLEVKSSNLRVGSTALFPDAPTKRGTLHLKELIRARRRGLDAGLLFLVQRPDVLSFAPNAELDPEFARTLAIAQRVGVRVVAQSIRVSPTRAFWNEKVPVLSHLPQERF